MSPLCLYICFQVIVHTVLTYSVTPGFFWYPGQGGGLPFRNLSEIDPSTLNSYVKVFPIQVDPVALFLVHRPCLVVDRGYRGPCNSDWNDPLGSLLVGLSRKVRGGLWIRPRLWVPQFCKMFHISKGTEVLSLDDS